MKLALELTTLAMLRLTGHAGLRQKTAAKRQATAPAGRPSPASPGPAPRKRA